MGEFLRLTPPAEALNAILSALTNLERHIESIPTVNSLGRIVAEDVIAPHPMPEFIRSAMDGYAVRAIDTYGVSDSQPGYLTLVGEIRMGTSPSRNLGRGDCMLIHTGGMLPHGSDAVIMLENTQLVKSAGKDAGITENQIVEVLRPVSINENIINMGEDINTGEVVIPAGRRVRPSEIGGLMAIGRTSLRVVQKPRVGILSSGDEVVPPAHSLQPGQVRDINTYTLMAMVEQAGGCPIPLGIIPDSPENLQIAAKAGQEQCDMLLITAGSSTGSRDNTAAAIESLGNPGVLVHGISIKPGKPTILAVCNNKPVIGMPGNPVSAVVISHVIVKPIIRHLLGETNFSVPGIKASLTVNVASTAGREDWIAVRFVQSSAISPKDATQTLPAVEPIFGKSNLIFNLVSADGLFCIPAEQTGASAGTIVDVTLLTA